MEDAPARLAEREVVLALPDGSTARIVGEAADESVVGSIASHGGSYEPGLMAALRSLVPAGAVCLDVGANVGPVTLALAALAGPGGAVHAFEPTAESFAFLRRNVAANAPPAAVHLHRLALSDREGTATINYNREAAGAAFISDHLADGVPQQVELATLDGWASGEGLARLDLLKVDVEGAELQVLDGGAATLARLRPTLVVEVNPVTLRRMQHRRPAELWRRLQAVHGRRGHLALVPDEGPMLPLRSLAQLDRHLAESGVCNLVCSPARLAPGRHPGMAGRGAAARAGLRSAVVYRRGGVPPWAAVVDPRVELHVDQPAVGSRRALTGAAGSRVVLPLIVANRGRVAIVGDAPRLPVSVRAVWIDPQGHHRVDDRSRVPAPTIRAGRLGRVDVPLVLPDEPGPHRLLLGLFQEHVAWFHDLDPANGYEIAVEVTPPAR